MNRIEVLRELNNLDLEAIELDFQKLKIKGKDAKPLSLVGNKVVYYFTDIERYDTKGKKGLSFFNFLENKENHFHRKYIQRMLEYYGTNEIDASVKVWKRIFNMYFGGVNVFKPITSFHLYLKYSPQCVLDPTMGWGGRLVGACALNIPHYIGIDNNQNLREPYDEMTKFLSNHSTTKIELFWGDCITFDYSKIEYDMVLTSPPYYNIEQYSFQEKRSKQEWNEKFYIPLVRETFKYLKNGGKYCLNIPIEVFELVKTILGEPNYTTPFPKSQRGDPNAKVVKGEFIYIWEK
jgi:hypothetical protein